MTTSKVLDAAYPRWTIAQLQTVGVGVMRYVGDPGNPKNIRQAEFNALVSGRVPFGLVFESNGTDYVGGRPAGLADGLTARRAAHALGWPDGLPIYSTVDRGDHANPAIVQYQAGYNAQSPACPGGAFYGDTELASMLFAAGLIRWHWQPAASAWPGGEDPRAALVQRFGLPIVGVTGPYDANDVFATNWGQYPAPAPPAPPPKPQPPHSTPMQGGPMGDWTRFEQTVVLDEHGAGHVPVVDKAGKPVSSNDVFAWGPIAVPDPARVGRYFPFPDVCLTIGANGGGELVLENGQPHGPASVRASHV